MAAASPTTHKQPLLATDTSVTVGAVQRWMAWPREGSWLGRSEALMSNRGSTIIILAVYIAASALAFQYGFHIAIDRHYTDLRKYITPVGRGCGVCLDMQCALLLLPMLRALLTKLRQTKVAALFPFDHTLLMHKIIAYVICFCTFLHGTGQSINYVLYYELTGGVFGKKQVLISGITLTVILVAIVVTSQSFIRRQRWFELFYYVHHLFPLFYVGLVFHGCRDGRPTTWVWIIGPVLMYAFDRFYRVCSTFTAKTTIVAAALPSPKVVHIVVDKPFQYKAGQYCELLIPAVSKSEWHPFTIASSPKDKYLEFYIQAAGNWTDSVVALAAEAADRARSTGRTMSTIGEFANFGAVCALEGVDIHVRGPFGAPAEHFAEYTDLVLISSGIGATPFASVCKDIAAARRMWARTVTGASATVQALRAAAAAGDRASSRSTSRADASLASASPARMDRDRLSSTAPWTARLGPNEVFDFTHPEWPFSGQCGCHPIRTLIRHTHQPLRRVSGTYQSGAATAGAQAAGGQPESTESWTALPVTAGAEAAGSIVDTATPLITMQRMMRTVTVQMALIIAWVVTATIAVSVIISASGYYWTCILIDKLHTDVVEPPPQVKLLLASEIIFFTTAVMIVVGIIVDVMCVGWTMFWRVPCLRHQTMMVLPGCIVLLTVNSLMSWDIWRPQLTLHYAIISFSKLALIVPLMVRFVHVTGSVTKLSHGTKDTSRIRSIRVYWTNRTAAAQQWLLPDIAKLERRDAEGLFSFHSYVTREEAPREQQRMLKHGVSSGRPKWDRIFERLAQHYPPGSQVGVFFCGAPSMARSLQQVCTSHSSSMVLFKFRKENF